MEINGTWHGWFVSRFSGKPHHLLLDLKLDGKSPVATLLLKRAEPDPINGLTDYKFKVHVEVASTGAHQFVALVAKDHTELGMIAMVLKAKDDALCGHLVFNNVRTQEVDHGEIEWRRQDGQPNSAA